MQGAKREQDISIKIGLKFGIPASPSLTMRFIPLLYNVKHCGAQGFRTYSKNWDSYTYIDFSLSAVIIV